MERKGGWGVLVKEVGNKEDKKSNGRRAPTSLLSFKSRYGPASKSEGKEHGKEVMVKGGGQKKNEGSGVETGERKPKGNISR